MLLVFLPIEAFSKRQNSVIFGNCSVKLIICSIFLQNCLIENNEADGSLFWVFVD